MTKNKRDFYIEPARMPTPAWALRHGDELWFNGKFVCRFDFRPDIKSVDRLEFIETVAAKLNQAKWVGT